MQLAGPHPAHALGDAGAGHPADVLQRQLAQDGALRPQLGQHGLVGPLHGGPGGRAAHRGPDDLGQRHDALKGGGVRAAEILLPVGQLLHPVQHAGGELAAADRQTPPAASASAGVSRRPQLRCPSKWYLPSSGKNSMVERGPRPPSESAPERPPQDSSASKRFASRPSLAGEWASELETKKYRSSAESRQFIGGSEESPVSSAWMWGVRSSKHSSMVSKPEKAPKSEKWGVQMWAGMNTASGQASSVSSSRSRLSRPRMGRRPSAGCTPGPPAGPRGRPRPRGRAAG